MKVKLSDRALEILSFMGQLAPDRRWLPDGGVARGGSDHHPLTGHYLNIAGAGDGAILRSFIRKGLLERRAPEHCGLGPYDWLSITPAGREVLAAHHDRETALLLAIRDKMDRDNVNSVKSDYHDDPDQDRAVQEELANQAERRAAWLEKRNRTP